MAHAFIIQSDDSKLADDFAIALAQMVSCPSPQSNGDSCGKCLTCRQLEARTYSELYTLAPVSKSRQIVIGEDESDPDTMRWFRGLFHMKSASAGGVKTGIIYDADCMNDKAQNCFLKTLEEPPPSSFIIIITANPSSMLPTILSRCQSILLLRNRIGYMDKKISGIIPLLGRLVSGDQTISNAEGCASAMIALSDGLHDFAEEKIKAKWKPLFKESEYLEKAGRKQLEKRFEAAVESEYIMMRDSMLSLIHTWSAQAYMMTCGIPLDSLANPEIFPDTGNNFTPARQKKAYGMMRKSEDLLQVLRWNVNTDLALREFCMGVVFGK